MPIDIEKLQQSNNELREIVNNSWDGIGIMDKKSKFIYVNNAFSPILGYKKEELLKNSFEYFILPEYKDAFKDLIQRNLENRYSSDVQVVCERKDSKKVYLQITLSLMLNKKFFVVNAKDITRQISDDEILNKYVISSHTDLNGIITDASDAFCYISGYSREELIGKPHSIIGHKDMPKEVFAKLWDTIKSGNEWSGRIRNLKKNGTDFWIDARIKPIYNKYGDITGFTSLMFDITDEVSLKSEKRTLQREVAQNQDELKIQNAKLNIMAETLQMISHEWRQPLNIISIQAQKLGLSYSMGNIPTAEETVKTLDEIKKRADEMSDIIEVFQNFIKLKSTKTDSNAKEIIQNAINRFDSEGIKINSDLKATPNFNTHKKELEEIIINLLTNSKEAIKRNNIPNGHIDIKLYNENSNTIVIKVIDNGGGIKPEIIEKIFDPYFSTKDSQHGVGLGLYMCKIIIEMHLNGTIEVLNQDNGTIFKISLTI